MCLGVSGIMCVCCVCVCVCVCVKENSGLILQLLWACGRSMFSRVTYHTCGNSYKL